MNASSQPVVSAAPSPIQSARALLKQLQERFTVFRDCLPLAIGVDKQLLAAVPDIERKILRLALRSHTHSLRYLKTMEKATQRFDLEGVAVAEVTDEHRAHATEILRERFRKEAELRRAKAEAEKMEKAEQQRAAKLNQLAAKFSKR
jgi:ProP effector